MYSIRKYEPRDEPALLRCRVLSLLDSSYFDDVWTSKPAYANPCLELVAENKGQIVGLIDVEAESAPGTICSERAGPRAMIWSIGVLPESRREGIARALVAASVEWARGQGVAYLEAWTRDDAWVRAWYDALGFRKFQSYWHAYFSDETARLVFSSRNPKLRVQTVFTHLLESPSTLGAETPSRLHRCHGYELPISSWR